LEVVGLTCPGCDRGRGCE